MAIRDDQKFSERMNTAAKARAEMLAKVKARAEAAKATADERAKERAAIAAARLAQKGDLVIIVAYARMEEAEAKSFQPRVLLVDANNKPQAPALRVLET